MHTRRRQRSGPASLLLVPLMMIMLRAPAGVRGDPTVVSFDGQPLALWDDKLTSQGARRFLVTATLVVENGDDVTLVGHGCTLDGQAQRGILTVRSGGGAVDAGNMTFERGKKDASCWDSATQTHKYEACAGGAVYMGDSSSGSFSSCTFHSNTDSDAGGGVYMHGHGIHGMPSSTTGSFSSCTFQSNTVSRGGGFGGGVYMDSSTTGSFSDCTFQSNTASGLGGSVYMRDSNTTGSFSSCAFYSNTAAHHGGGMFMFLSATGSVSSCTFQSNTAKLLGGSIYGEYAVLHIHSCLFSHGSAMAGSVLYIDDPSKLHFSGRNNITGGHRNAFASPNSDTIPDMTAIATCPPAKDNVSGYYASIGDVYLPLGAWADEFYTCPQVCEPGKYTPEGSTGIDNTAQCTACPAGHFSSQPRSPKCHACPNGRLNSQAGSLGVSTCEACTAGTACIGGTRTACGANAANVYCPAETKFKVTVEAGYYSVDDGFGTTGLRTGVAPCEPGYACSNGTRTACVNRGDNTGTFADGGSAMECKHCTYCPSGWGGSDNCTTTTDTVCEECAQGRFSESTADFRQVCSTCPTGYWQNAFASLWCDQCTVCQAGKFILVPCTADTNDNVCEECPAGFYGEGEGQVTCKTCTAGTFQLSTSKQWCDTCLSCEAGKYESAGCTPEFDGACAACPAGFWSMGYDTTGGTGTGGGSNVVYTNYKNCTPCHNVNEFCRASASGTSSVQSGFFSLPTTDPSKVQLVNGKLVCTGCNEPKTNEAACVHGTSWCENGVKRDCKLCPAGQFASSACMVTRGEVCAACEPGRFTAENTAERACKACPVGWYQGGRNGQSCVACGAGTYQSAAGRPACLACPEGRLGRLENATSVSVCVACDRESVKCTDGRSLVVKPGFFRNPHTMYDTNAVPLAECANDASAYGDDGVPVAACAWPTPEAGVKAEDFTPPECKDGHTGQKPDYCAGTYGGGTYRPIFRAMECVGSFRKACLSFGVQLRRRNATSPAIIGSAYTPPAAPAGGVTNATALAAALAVSMSQAAVPASLSADAVVCAAGTNTSVPLCAACLSPQYYRNTSTNLCTKCEADAGVDTSGQAAAVALCLILLIMGFLIKFYSQPESDNDKEKKDEDGEDDDDDEEEEEEEDDEDDEEDLFIGGADVSEYAQERGMETAKDGLKAVREKGGKVDFDGAAKLKNEANLMKKRAAALAKKKADAATQKAVKALDALANQGVDTEEFEAGGGPTQTSGEDIQAFVGGVNVESKSVDNGGAKAELAKVQQELEDLKNQSVNEAAEMAAAVKEGGLELWDETVNAIKLFVSFAQVVSMMGSSYNIPWPPAFTQMQNILAFPSNILDFSVITRPVVDFFQLLASSFTPLACQSKSASFGEQFYMHIAFLPIMMAVMLVALGLSLLIRNLRCPNRFSTRAALSRFVVLLNALVFIMYPGLGIRVVRVFKCRQVYGIWRMEADLSVVCSTYVHPAAARVAGPGFQASMQQHKDMVATAIVTMLVVVFGVPIVYAFILLRARNKSKRGADGEVVLVPYAHDGLLEERPKNQLSEPNFKRSCGTVYKAYDQDFCWFESVDLLRKFVLTGGMLLLPTESITSLFLATLVAFAYLVVIINVAPLKDSRDDTSRFSPDFLLQLTNIQIFLTCLAGIMIKSRKECGLIPAGGPEDLIFDALLTTTQAFILIIGMGSIYSLAEKNIRKAKKKHKQIGGKLRKLSRTFSSKMNQKFGGGAAGNGAGDGQDDDKTKKADGKTIGNNKHDVVEPGTVVVEMAAIAPASMTAKPGLLSRPSRADMKA